MFQQNIRYPYVYKKIVQHTVPMSVLSRGVEDKFFLYFKTTKQYTPTFTVCSLIAGNVSPKPVATQPNI